MQSMKRAVTFGLIASAILGAGYGLHKQTALASVLGYQTDRATPFGAGARYTAANQTTGPAIRTLPRPPNDLSPPLQPANRPLIVRAVPDIDLPSPTVHGDTDDTGRSCAPRIDAALTQSATVMLALDAPCNANTRVDIRHAGLKFSGRTDAGGQFSTAAPALTILASYQAQVAGETADVTVAVPDVTNVRRIAVQWNSTDDMSLHALEFGAAYGGPGHVWGQAPGRPGGGGTLMQLGRPEFGLAEVYSLPTDHLPDDSSVEVRIEAHVTDQTCGRLIEGQAIQTMPNGAPRISALRLQMPECGAAEGILVLKKQIGHIKIAGN